MRDLLHELIDSANRQRPVVYCRLVETRGSTPQKPGATMLVYEDGSQAGTLGGGCVEAEVKRRAIAALRAGDCEIATFTLDHDYGWDDGLICGGRMKVLIRPVSDRDTIYFSRMVDAIEAGSGVTEAVVFESQDACLQGNCYLFAADNSLLVSLPEHSSPTPTALQQLRPVDSRPRAYNANGVAYLPSLSRCRLIIIGAGHVGQAVAELATRLDFDVWVVDDRTDCVTEERFPTAQRRIHGDISQVLRELEITSESYCLVVTRGHNHDQEALYQLAGRGASYLGMIGSQRKIKLIFDNLLDSGVSQVDLDKVHAPLGIDIGSQTVPEIAVSICAELIAHRNLGRVLSGRGSE